MNKSTSVIAALDAGKLPSQQQISQLVDWLLQNIVNENQVPEGSKLSDQGKTLAGGLKDVLKAYKKLGDSKNADNILQETLWHLSEGDISETQVELMDTDEAFDDAKKLRSAIRTMLSIVWTNATGEGTSLLHDFASFSRLALADFAEIIEAQAGQAKQSLRELDSEVQEGDRDNLGRKRKSPEEAKEDEDVRVKFEKSMDSAKVVGSKAIGVGQHAKASAEDTAQRTSNRLQEAYHKICDRAQNDEAYHDSLTVLFNTIEKWLNRTLDTAADVNQSISLDTFIDDPTEEKHIYNAIHNVRTLFERLAGGKSLDDVFAKVRLCAVDIRQDPDLKEWFNDFFAHVRESLDKPGYARSDEAQRKYEKLSQRWQKLLDKDSDVGRKWKEDAKAFRKELHAFEHAVAKDADLQRVRKAHAKLGKDLERVVVSSAGVGLQFAVDQASWFWQDLFNVYAPKIFNVLKDIPIPRTEYVDPEVEFVLENVDISSLNLLPGHVYVRNITDIDIQAPASSPTTTTFGTLTHVRLQAVQLTLKEVSFWYKDKTAMLGPSEFMGIMEFDLPSRGIDIDLKLRLLPNTPEGLKQRERQGSYHNVERIEVSVAEDISFQVKQSNHAILASVFKPIITMRLKEALEKTMQEQIRAVLETMDSVAWDIGRRSEVFTDTGLGSGVSVIAAVWSEIGKMRKTRGGLTSGWQATGTGVIKEAEGDAKFAMGAEPQILSGEKRGPMGTNSEPLADRLPDVDVERVTGSGKGAAERVSEAAQQGLNKVLSFKDSVQAKAEKEKSTQGWQSSAFDFA